MSAVRTREGVTAGDMLSPVRLARDSRMLDRVGAASRSRIVTMAYDGRRRCEISACRQGFASAERLILVRRNAASEAAAY